MKTINKASSGAMEKTESSELKKQLALLKSEYLKKTKALRKVEKRERRKAHIKQRVQEEAEKSAIEGTVPDKIPSKVKFDTNLAPNITVNQETDAKSVKFLQPILVNTENSCSYQDYSQLDFSDSLERKVGKIKNKKRKDRKRNLDIISTEKSNIYDKPVTIENILRYKSVEESIVDSQSTDSDCLNHALIDMQYQLLDDSEASHLLHVPTCKSSSQEKLCNVYIPSISSKDQSDHTFPTKSAKFSTVKPKRKSTSNASLLDFSFLEDENDLYSQVKQRRSRSRSLPFESYCTKGISEADSQSSQDTMDMSVSPRILQNNTEGISMYSEKANIDLTTDSTHKSCEPPNQKAFPSEKQLDAEKLKSVESSKTFDEQILLKTKRSTNKKRPSMPCKLSSYESLELNSSQESLRSLMNSLIGAVENKQEEFSLPENEFGKLTTNNIKSRQSILNDEETIPEVKLIKTSVKGTPEESISPLQTTAKLLQSPTSRISSLLNMAQNGSQFDFQTQPAHRRRNSIGRGRKRQKTKEPIGDSLSTDDSQSVKHAKTDSQKEIVAESDPDCPLQYQFMLNDVGEVYSVESKEIKVSDEVTTVILTCTHSSCVIWVEEETGWKQHLSYCVSDGEKILAGSIVFTRQNVPVLVTASVTKVSYLFKANTLYNEASPVILDEIPLQKKVCRASPLMCGISSTSSVVITKPYPEMRNNTDLTAYSLHIFARSNLELNGTKENNTANENVQLNSAQEKIISVCEIVGTSISMVLGISKKSIFIWCPKSGKLLKEIACQYPLVQCAAAIREKGVLFMPCLLDLPSVGGGGLLAVNPSAGKVVLINPLESGSFSSSRRQRWQNVNYNGDLLFVSSKSTVAVYSAFWGQLVAYLPGLQGNISIACSNKFAVISHKSSVLIYKIMKK